MKVFGTRSALGRIAASSVAGVVVLSTAACGSSSGGGVSSDGSLKVLMPGTIALLDPTQASVQGVGALMLGLEPLLRMQPDGTLEPNLATDVTQPDPRTYVYKIREGVEFWDDSPLTPDDVVYSFNLHAGDGSTSINTSLWSSVSSIEKSGEDEVTVKLTDPDPQIPYVVAMTGIVSKAYHEQHKDDAGTPGVLNIGTGPYEFESFKPSSEIVLKANDNYWGDEPAYDEVIARSVTDDSTRLLAIQSGEFDGIFNAPLAQLGSYEGIEGYELAEAADYSVYKFNFDTDKAPWNDIHLRRAVALALNRPDLVEGPLQGKATLAPTLVPPDVMTTLVQGDEVTESYEEFESQLPFDLDAAREEMAKSTVPDGVSVTLPVMGSDPNLAAIAQTAAQTLSEIGVKVKIQEVDDNTYYNATYFEHTTDGLTLDNFGASSPDPASIPLYALLSSNALPGGSGVNIAQYSNPHVDDVLHSSQQLGVDDPNRGSLLIEALKLSQADLPYVPIAYPNAYAVGNSDLDLSQFTAFWWLTDWTKPTS